HRRNDELTPRSPCSHRNLLVPGGTMTALSTSSLAILDDAHAITADPADGRAPVLTTAAGLDQPATAVARAELIATAHGLYEMRIGGAPATESVLNPGWTTYEKRLQVQRFD